MVLCPECGRTFSARGLAGHRRLAHGSPGSAERGEDAGGGARPPAEGGGEASRAAGLALDAEVLAAAVLGALGPALERLEELAERVEGALLAAGTRPSVAPSSATPRSGEDLDGSRLRCELEGVLGAIEREKGELRSLEQQWGGEPRDDAERERRERAWRRLGRLRRRQASLIFRLEELVPGSQPGAGDSGVGTL